MKRGQSGICAIVAVDKPRGCSSHDVVSMVRRACGERRVGHAGTLDPFATGLLVIGIGAATRLTGSVMDATKTYEARLAFGMRTATDDLSGEVLEERPVPSVVFDEDGARSVLQRFVGEQMQLPPAYSAKKKDGRKAYELAREGMEVDLEPVKVHVHEAELLRMEAGFLCDGDCANCIRGEDDGSSGSEGKQAGGLDVGPSDLRMVDLPWWDVRFTVSKGTYIRALARDIGETVGCGAHLSRLRRTSMGDLRVDDAVGYEEIGRLGDPDFLGSHCIDPVEALGLHKVECGGKLLERVLNGAPVSLDFGSDGRPQKVGMVSGGRLHAVYSAPAAGDVAHGGGGVRYTSEIVIPDGVVGVG